MKLQTHSVHIGPNERPWGGRCHRLYPIHHRYYLYSSLQSWAQSVSVSDVPRGKDNNDIKDSLVYETAVFIGHLYRRLVVYVRFISVAKVSDTVI
jgi:hypothetical protein